MNSKSFAVFYTHSTICRNKTVGADILCEMRFHVPNNELDQYEEERQKAKEERRKKRAEEKKVKAEAGEESKEQPASEEESSDQEEMNAAKLFDQKIHKRANIGEFAGEVICSIHDLPMIIPRGN